MKKLFAILAVMGVLTLGSVQPIMAQDAAPAQTEQTTEAAVVEEGGGLHKELKTKFIEGDAGFMSLVAIALVLGLAFCIERIIYLSLAEVNTKKLMTSIEAALEKGDVEAAKTVCRNTRGPVASICYQGLMRIDDGVDVVERSVVSYGGVQAGYLEKGCSWITLFIAMAPSLGFLGTVIGMVFAFDKIQQAGDISPTVVPVFWTLAMIAATYYMVHEVFTNYFGLKWYEGGMVTLLILLMFYQWIPSSAIGMYWYVGVIHYMMPHVLAMLLIGFLLKYLRTDKFRYIIFSVFGMIAIGGSSYYSAFLVLFSYDISVLSIFVRFFSGIIYRLLCLFEK